MTDQRSTELSTDLLDSQAAKLLTILGTKRLKKLVVAYYLPA